MTTRLCKGLMVISMFILIAGCGQKRDLYLPDADAEPSSEQTENAND